MTLSDKPEEIIKKLETIQAENIPWLETNFAGF
jgi:hypothetical protein